MIDVSPNSITNLIFIGHCCYKTEPAKNVKLSQTIYYY
jgi:hypothetical protein